METKLPESVRLKLAETLARYSEWEGVDPESPPPAPIRMLGNSANNCSILVANDRKYVVRVNRHTHDFNALDPGAESMAMSLAAAAGLAPALRFASTGLGTLVCDYLAPDPAPTSSIKSLAALLRGIHRLPATRQVLSLSGRIRHYRQALSNGRRGPRHQELLSLSESAIECAERLAAVGDSMVLCHNDLLPANRLLSGGRLWAIDWEYAAMGSRWFDIAVVCCGEAWDEPARRLLLNAYLGRSPSTSECRRLAWATGAYHGLEQLWLACNRGSRQTRTTKPG
jgi:aminoglycoside phosphotransferase (APT) family kinase protein